MSNGDLPAPIAALQLPAAYPFATERIELRQTHISYVFLAGAFAYKIKKPIDLGFLDYSTLAKRKHFCEEEVRLNRRLSDDVYLDVVPVSQAGGQVKLEAAGEVIDYAVKMRRMPDGRMMDRLLAQDAVTPRLLGDLAQRIAAFHASSERNETIDSLGGLETAMVNWHENFEQTEGFIGRTIHQHQFDEIKAFVEETAQLDADMFGMRVSQGRARDCHGDLRSDAVCFLESGVCILDCIEFNERFRYSDVAADVAFLAMDLEYRGRRDLADELLGLYLGATLDATLPLVLPFYKCYRAYVRGKVEGFQLDAAEIDVAQKRSATERARRYFDLAHAYTSQGMAGTLIITAGVTGSGKSYLGNALAARLGAVILSSDVVRKRLLSIEPGDRHFVPYESGIYRPEVTEQTYAALLDEARPWLERGRPVILDASYLRKAHRQAALRLAQDCDARFLTVECETDEAVIYERLSERYDGQPTVSDGRWEIYQAQQDHREPLDELPIGTHLAVDTATPLRDQIDAVLDYLGEAIPGDKTSDS